MKIQGIGGDNDFGVEGKDVAVDFLFEDARDIIHDTANGCAFVWIGGELDGAVNYCYQGDMCTGEMFTEEEMKQLYEYVKNNFE